MELTINFDISISPKKFVKTSYLIRWPDAVSLNVSPARYFQTGRVFTVIFRHDDRVRRDSAILIAKIILPEAYLNRGTASAHLRWHHLGRRFWRCQDRHFLLPHSLGTEAYFRLRLYPKDVRLSGY